MKKLFVQLPSLQFFAAGDNNDQPVRRYEKRYKDLIPTVFSKLAYFQDFSAGGLEALDGVSESATAFSIKTTDIPVTIRAYDTGANVAFNTGSDTSSRFGPRTEIIAVNTDVPYTATWAYREGLDRFTTNQELNAAVADRLALQAEAQTALLDKAVSDYLDANATVTETLAGYTDTAVIALFNELSKVYTNLRVNKQNVVAKVNPDLYNAIVNGSLTTTGKGSSVNIDANGIARFKGIAIVEVPEDLLPTGVAALVYPINLGKTFVGISTARTIESSDFDGIELQGAGKYGNFTTNDNKKAIVKVEVTVGP